MKLCTKCFERKPESEFYHTVRQGKNCVSAACKLCAKKASVQYREAAPRYIESKLRKQTNVKLRNPTAESRVCSRCSLEKITSEFFTYRKKNRTYLRGVCKSCELERNRKWAQNNRTYIRQTAETYRHLNREQINEQRKKWRFTNDIKNATGMTPPLPLVEAEMYIYKIKRKIYAKLN